MRKSLIIATSAGALLLAGSAFAASMTVNGAIKTIDAKANSIVLENGKSYALPKGFDLKTLKVGEKVNVTFEEKDGKAMASDVKAG